MTGKVEPLKFRHPAEGVDPGCFEAPDTLVVDGFDRVFVSDIWGVQVIYSNGQYLDNFSVEVLPLEWRSIWTTTCISPAARPRSLIWW